MQSSFRFSTFFIVSRISGRKKKNFFFLATLSLVVSTRLYFASECCSLCDVFME